MNEQHKNLIEKIKEEQDKEFYDLFDKRFLEISRLADNGDDIGCGKGLAQLQIDINKWHISSLPQVMEVIKGEIEEKLKDIDSATNPMWIRKQIIDLITTKAKNEKNS